MSGLGGRVSDPNGLALMLADSQTASNTFGFYGGQFANVPKSKFMFYVKFYRPVNQGGSDWQRGLGFSLKSIDRPRISFNQEVLNQYNKKRIVQTSHEFEAVQMRFHDTVDESLNRMFIEYYQYYFGDSKIQTSGSTVYDVVLGDYFRAGEWGFHPPMADKDYGYFFSHVSVYQLYNGQVARFDLINPKIQSYNPDDFDYSSGQVPNEIQLTLAFEGIVFQDPTPLPDDLANEMGIDKAKYYDVEDSVPDFNPGAAVKGTDAGTFGDAVTNALTRNLAGLITGQGGSSLANIGIEIASSFDANRGLAIGNVGIKSISDLVSGNTARGTQGVQGLLKGVLFGKPGKFF